MTKMTEAQRKAILDQHHQPGRPLGHRVMLSTWSAMVRRGWAVGSRLDGYYTPAGLRAAGVDLDALHAEALTEDFLRREALKLNAPVPAFNETVHFKHGGRVISGTVSAAITGMPEGDKVIVYSPTLGHTNRIDHGVTVSVVDLLSDAPVEPEPWSLDALPVVIEAHVEQMLECTERMEVSRAEWDAMTPAQRRDTIDTFGAETMNNRGGYGASIVSGAPDSDLDDPPAPPTAAEPTYVPATAYGLELWQHACGSTALEAGPTQPHSDQCDSCRPTRPLTSDPWHRLYVRVPNTPGEARTGIPDRVAAALQELSDLRAMIRTGVVQSHDARSELRERVARAEQLLRAEAGWGLTF